MAQPAMQNLAMECQKNHIEVMVYGRPWLADVLPFLNLGQNAHYVSTSPEMHPTDSVVLFPNSLGAAWRAYRTGFGQRIGFQGQWRNILLTHGFKPRLNMAHEHHREYFLDLVTQMGIPTPQRDVQLKAREEDIHAGHALMQRHGLDPEHTLCIAPGAQYGNAKRYPAEQYNQVLQHLSAQGWQCITLGMQEERDICNQCLSSLSGTHWNSAGETSLTEALQLVASCRLLLCNDSGLMHVAAGLQQPVVAMFGATNPERTYPSGNRVHLLYQPADCSPCLKRDCHIPGHPCMANISPNIVISACESMLNP